VAKRGSPEKDGPDGGRADAISRYTAKLKEVASPDVVEIPVSAGM
jgi:hypothetical protein